jgi:hypothetical protein
MCETPPSTDQREPEEPPNQGRHRPFPRLPALSRPDLSALSRLAAAVRLAVVPRVVAVARLPAAPRVVVAALVASVVAASVPVFLGGGHSRPPTTVSAADLAVWRLMELHGDRASRSIDRAVARAGAAASPAASATASGSTPGRAAKANPAVPAPAASPSPTVSHSPEPVGGLSTVQMAYASTIVSVGRQLQLPSRAYIVAIATALQESKLLNLANWGLAESLDVAHDGVGGDFDSVGLFQQRPSSGWGSVAELMDPATSARKFYQALTQVVGWEAMPVTLAAQAVQGSAFPDAYAQHETLATQIVSALTTAP